jgi:ABC-type branched-subunit amino acid transport system ATPase component
VRDLTKRFGGLLAVNGCSFEVEAGTVVGLIGPNGSGKSTVFNLITNLLHADSGSVLHDGAPIGGLKLHDVARRGIGRTFQEVKIFRELTVWENLGLAALGRGVGPNWRRAHAFSRLQVQPSEQEIGENPPTASKASRNCRCSPGAAELPPRRAAGRRPSRRAPRSPASSAASVAPMRHPADRARHALRHGPCDRVVVMDHGEKIADGPPAQIRADGR